MIFTRLQLAGNTKILQSKTLYCSYLGEGYQFRAEFVALTLRDVQEVFDEPCSSDSSRERSQVE